MRLWFRDHSRHMAASIRHYTILRMPAARARFSIGSHTADNAWANKNSRMAHMEWNDFSLLQSERHWL